MWAIAKRLTFELTAFHEREARALRVRVVQGVPESDNVLTFAMNEDGHIVGFHLQHAN